MPTAERSVARLIVCERVGHWALALRRELGDAGVRVWETRTRSDCREELAHSPASFVVVELGENLPKMLDWLARQLHDFPTARFAVVADRRHADREPIVREAGAVHFLTSPRRIAPLARIACRHLAQVPPPQQSLTDRIWSSLPWGE